MVPKLVIIRRMKVCSIRHTIILSDHTTDHKKRKNASKRCGEMEQFYVELKVLSLLSAHILLKLYRFN